MTLSTTETKFIATAATACQAIWLRRILKELSYSHQDSTLIYCDNVSAIKLSKNLILHGKSKHIDVRLHFLRDLRKRVIDMIWCNNEGSDCKYSYQAS